MDKAQQAAAGPGERLDKQGRFAKVGKAVWWREAAVLNRQVQ